MPSTRSATRAATAPLYLSPYELPNLIENEEEFTEVTRLLADRPHLYPRFLHYHSLICTIRRLKQTIDKTKTELEETFHAMQQHDLDNTLRPYVARKRQTRYTPYQQTTTERPPSTVPSSSNTPLQPSPQPRQVPIRSRSPSVPDLPILDGRDSPPVTVFVDRVMEALRGFCMKCGHQGHNADDCDYQACDHCNGRHHVTDCPRRDEFIVLPNKICISPSGAPIRDKNGNIRTRPFTRSCLRN